MAGISLETRLRKDDLTELLKGHGLVELNYFWKMKHSGWTNTAYERDFLEIRVGDYTARCGTSGLFDDEDENKLKNARTPKQAAEFLKKGAEKIRKYLKEIGNPDCPVICYYLKGYQGHDEPLFVVPEK